MDIDFERTQPTDDGLGGVLNHCPVWDKLAIRLGVTISQKDAYKRNNPHASDDAALASLQQWRDGKNDGYPATWEFLLGKVKEEYGINVANTLRGKIKIEKNWTQGQPSISVPGPISRVKNDPPNSGERYSDCDPKPEEPKSRLGIRNRRPLPPSSHGINLNRQEEISANPPSGDLEIAAEREMEDVNDKDTLIIPDYFSRYKPARASSLYKHCRSWMRRGTLLAKYLPYFIVPYIFIFLSHYILHPNEGLWFRIYQGMGWLMRQKTVILWAVLHIPIVLALLLCISSLLSFLQWLYRLDGNKILESTGFVIKFDQRVFLVTCLHSFFEYDELKDDADKVLLPNGYDIAEHIKSRILDTYSFQFHSAANLKRGRDILLKGYGVPNVFVDMGKDIIVLQLREQPEGVHPIETTGFIKDSVCTDWKYAAIDIYGYHNSTLNYTHGTIISTAAPSPNVSFLIENGEEGAFCYTASTDEGFSGAPVLVALENHKTASPTLCPLAVHTNEGDDDELYNMGSFLWPLLLTIRELRQFWSELPQGPMTLREEKIIRAGIVVRSMTF